LTRQVLARVAASLAIDKLISKGAARVNLYDRFQAKSPRETMFTLTFSKSLELVQQIALPSSYVTRIGR